MFHELIKGVHIHVGKTYWSDYQWVGLCSAQHEIDFCVSGLGQTDFLATAPENWWWDHARQPGE